MYKELFEEAFEVLKNHPHIDIKQLDVALGATPEQIDAFEMIAGIRLPEHIKALYLYANGITCIWAIKQGLSEDVMEKIRAEGEQLDYDYSKPIGAIKILPIQDMLFNKAWEVPYQQPPQADEAMNFAGQATTLGVFSKQMRIFDYYEANAESEATVMLTDWPSGKSDFQLLLLDQYLVDWKQSNVIDFETYIRAICKTRFTIPSRKLLFGKKFLAEPVVIGKAIMNEVTITPALFK